MDWSLPRKGSFDDEYTLLELLGEGGFGQVYRGRSLRTGEECAIKLIPDDSFHRDMDKFRREIAILKRLRGVPGVVRLVDAFNTPTHLVICTELLTGGTLQHLVNRRACLSEREVRILMHQFLTALEGLAARGVAHNDIKGDNIMFDRPWPEGRLCLVDMGLALTEEEFGKTRAAEGNSAFSSPEMFLQAFWTVKSDVWQAGVLMYYCACGTYPFSAPALTVQVDKTSFTQNVDTFSPLGWNLVHSMLQFHAHARPTPTEALQHPWFCEADGARPDATLADKLAVPTRDLAADVLRTVCVAVRFLLTLA